MQEMILLGFAIGIQAFATLFDEFYFHYRRSVPRWERIGHPLDTLTVILVFASFYFTPSHEVTPLTMILLMAFSCLFITKDEFVHAKLANAGEQWLHAVLFVVHPAVFFLSWLIWKQRGPQTIHGVELLIAVGFFLYQAIYWNVVSREEPVDESIPTVNNELYHDLGERWYHADDDPVALLRSEAKIKNPWVVSRIRSAFPNRNPGDIKVLDVGCGAGFLSNDLSKDGYSVTGLDLSEPSLRVAKNYDETGKVNYVNGNAYALPFEAQSFDIVCSMDFLEHVDDPARRHVLAIRTQERIQLHRAVL